MMTGTTTQGASRGDDNHLWSEAKTLDDLGELTARWIEGNLSFSPLYGGDFRAEADYMQDALAYLNRHGFVTDNSQPGRPEIVRQPGTTFRAFVEGYATKEVAEQLETLGLYTDLVVLIFPPGVTGGYNMPVSLYEYHPTTWVGIHLNTGGFFGGLDGELYDSVMKVLVQYWRVVVIDPRWGRQPYLWKNIRSALSGPADAGKGRRSPYDIAPSPILEEYNTSGYSSYCKLPQSFFHQPRLQPDSQSEHTQPSAMAEE